MEEILPPYFLKLSSRSRTVRVSVKVGGLVTVSAPRRTSESVIKSFLLEHAGWLQKKVEYFKKFSETGLSRAQEKQLFILYKARAELFAKNKVIEHNKRYRFSFNKISVRNSRTRWGSCSRKGTLSFNYKIVFLPEHLADYLVVHELCHLREHNHGKAFWSLVSESVPDYALRRKELRNFDLITSVDTNIL